MLCTCETCRQWMDFEDELFDCRPCMLKPLAIPVLRIVSSNDPIVPFETIDEKLFENLDQCLVHDAGHTAAFASDPGLAKYIRQWVQTHS